MSVTDRPLSTERMAAGFTRPIREWTDELVTDGLRYVVALLRQAGDPEEERLLLSALADQGVTGTDAETALRREARAYVNSLVCALADLSHELGRRHPEFAIGEEHWRGALGSTLAQMVRRRRG